MAALQTVDIRFHSVIGLGGHLVCKWKKIGEQVLGKNIMNHLFNAMGTTVFQTAFLIGIIIKHVHLYIQMK